MNLSTFISVAFMLVGVICFECIPGPLLRLFSRDTEVLRIGVPAFRIIGASFLSAGAGLMCPVFFQAIGRGRESVFLSLLRQIFCLVPFFWVFSLIGLGWTWLAFPVSETITAAFGLTLYRRELRRWESGSAAPLQDN